MLHNPGTYGHNCNREVGIRTKSLTYIHVKYIM